VSALRIVDLSMSYGSVRVFDGINLLVPDGTLLALLGPSGCGKSTMLQLIAGFERPSAGEIWAGDQCMSSPATMVPTERRGISMVFQNYAVWPHMTVEENVAFGLRIQRLPQPEMSRKLARALQMVRLDALRDRYPAELSGGQQQRVALARALAVEPKILALDEPLSNLDAHLREEMRFEIRRVHDQLGITTLYVTHDQSEALVTADQIAVMQSGVLMQVGTPQDLFERPANSFVARFIGNSNVVAGTLEGPGRVRIGPHSLPGIDRSGAAPGAAVSFCIRPTQILVDQATDEASSLLRGTVMRSAYLGEARDLLIEVENFAPIRASVPAAREFSAGQQVTLHLPVESCLIVNSSAM
jgi:iron(III) transport system ATP-binding protein